MPSPAAATELPADLEAMVQRWRDEIVDGLPTRPRTLYRDARIRAYAPGRLEFMVLNEAHRRSAEACRGEVEAALSERLGQPFTVEVVYEPAAASAAAPVPEEDPGLELDLEATTPVVEAGTGDLAADRILEAFPGASAVEG